MSQPISIVTRSRTAHAHAHAQALVVDSETLSVVSNHLNSYQKLHHQLLCTASGTLQARGEPSVNLVPRGEALQPVTMDRSSLQGFSRTAKPLRGVRRPKWETASLKVPGPLCPGGMARGTDLSSRGILIVINDIHQDEGIIYLDANTGQ